MRQHIARFLRLPSFSSALEVGGLTAIAAGVGLIYLPAGIIAAGAAAVLLGYALGGDK